MADTVQVILHQRLCRGCTTLFWICRRCDRGQRYCSPGCRHAARHAQLLAVRCRHRRRFQSRLKRSRQQQRYRDRIKAGAKIVGHQGSIPDPVSDIIPPWDSRSLEPPPRLRCVHCGVRGEFVDPFPFTPKSGW